MINNLGSLIIDSIRLKYLKKEIKSIGKVDNLLDLGCGIKPYESIYKTVSDFIVGIDIFHAIHGIEKVDVLYDGINFPFTDNKFDLVLCTEVLEHVYDTKKFLSEIYRIMKKESLIILTVPFLVAIIK